MTTNTTDTAEGHWVRWVMQTARNSADIADVLKPTGIDVLDDDHQKLTQLTLEINNLLDASKEGQFSLDTIRQQRHLLESIYAYAEHHFHREEELIEKLGLPNAEWQRSQHKAFLDMLRKALDDFNQGRLTVSLHLKQTILEWWVKHINELDYQTFCQENLIQRVLATPDTWHHLIPLIKPTGVAAMDDEHRKLIHAASEWVQALQAGKDGIQTLRTLEQSALEHFRDEEVLIEQFGLPGLAIQRTQHAKFMEKLRDLEVDRSTTPVDAVRLVLNWWISHINETDAISFSADHLGARLLDDSVTWDQLEKFIVPTGFDAIDSEHRTLAEKMLKLDFSAPAADTLGQIDEIITLARHHFVHEEDELARKDSPLLRVHADDHLKFLGMTSGFRDDMAVGRLKLSVGLRGYLLKWWIRHIREYDVPAFASWQEQAT